MQNQATEKLSPEKSLSSQQQRLVDEAIHFIKLHLLDTQPAVLVISGDAGTGKSVVLSQLFRIIQHERTQSDSKLFNTTNYFLVNHPELLKVYREIAGQNAELRKKDFQRPTTLINQLSKAHNKFDVGVIDEAHLLLSQPDHYNNFYGHNQLLSLLKVAHVLIIVFDEHQVLRFKTYWSKAQLQQLLRPFTQKWLSLDEQFRMQASSSVLNWVNDFTQKHILSPIQPNFFDHNYDFQIFDDAEQMRQAIVSRNNQAGLSRVVATTGYPSVLDGGQHYVREGQFKLPWDQYNYTSTPWAEKPETINEVGSIYTCQGFDLNYVGLIIGPPVKLAGDHIHLEVNASLITDPEAFKRRHDMTDPRLIEQATTNLVMNAINVLMKRGVKGLYIFAHDQNLRDQLYSAYLNAKTQS